MKINFSKYQGTGNDFILIDNRKDVFSKNAKAIQRLCDRNFGIGSDGLILIENHPDLDYKMVFYNPDGSESLCGNGSRCGFQFARELGMVDAEATFETTNGIHSAFVKEDQISFSLFDVDHIAKVNDDFYTNTGSPHYVKIVKDIDSVEILEEGRKIRHSEAYLRQNGTNVNFAQLLHDRVAVRTYERGVENETLSCGTGVTAVGLVAARLGYESPVTVETRGGSLLVTYEKTEEGFRNIWLTGPATFVFSGSIEL